EQMHQPILQRRVIVVGQGEIVCDAYRVVTIEPESHPCGQHQPHHPERRDNRERRTARVCGKPHRASYTESIAPTPAATPVGPASTPTDSPRPRYRASRTSVIEDGKGTELDAFAFREGGRACLECGMRRKSRTSVGC